MESRNTCDTSNEFIHEINHLHISGRKFFSSKPKLIKDDAAILANLVNSLLVERVLPILPNNVENSKTPFLKEDVPDDDLLKAKIRYRVFTKMKVQDLNQKRAEMEKAKVDRWTGEAKDNAGNQEKYRQLIKDNIVSVDMEIMDRTTKTWYVYKTIENQKSVEKKEDKKSKKDDADEEKSHHRKRRFLCCR